MKSLLFIPVLALPLLFTGCETTVVERHPHHYGYVERETYYHRPYRRNVVVVESRPAYYRPYYAPRTEVRYYHDYRGRYYYRGGRRIYVNAGVYY